MIIGTDFFWNLGSLERTWSAMSTQHRSDRHPIHALYGSYQNFTATVTWAEIACPFLVAGLYW